MELQNQYRFTHAFFVHADDDAVISRIDDKGTFPPPDSQEFVRKYIVTNTEPDGNSWDTQQ